MSGNLAGRALDTHVDLIRFVRSDGGRRYLAGLAGSMDVEERGMVLTHQAALDDAATYAVDEAITDTLEAAANAVTEDEHFHLRMEDVPTGSGFVYLERPLVLHDDVGAKALVVRAFTWACANLMAPPADRARRFEFIAGRCPVSST